MRLLALIIWALPLFSIAQSVSPSPEHLKSITPLWTGERSPDGRPHVSEKLLERLKNISVEEAWGFLRNKGYQNQYENDWFILKPEIAMTGRVVTAQYAPLRPDLEKVWKDKGKEEGRIGAMNSWPIDVLKPGDIYIADGFGKIVDGTLIGDNLGNAIFAKSKNGVVFNGSVRDIEGLAAIEGFNAFTKGHDPSYIQQMMLSGLNVPIRMGRAFVVPGDVLLAKKGGIVFIPPHLLDELIINSEFVQLRDKFGHQRLIEGKYTPGEIDTKWTDAIKSDFLTWLDSQKLPMSRSELDNYMKDRTW